MLVRGLPVDAATVRAIHPEAEWSTTDYLLAALVDTAQASNWLFVEANKRKSARNPRPEPVRRPGEQERNRQEPQRLNGRELADWLQNMEG